MGARGRPRKVEEYRMTERLLFHVTPELRDELFDYVMYRMAESRDISFGMANGLRELMALGLQVWKERKGE